MASRTRLVSALVSGWLLLAASTASSGRGIQAPQPTPDPELFEVQVRPLLVNVCFRCHTDDEEGGLRLDSRENMLKGGEKGPAIVPGDPEASLLIKAVRHAPGAPKMPRKAQQLTDQQVDALVQWIRIGAPWPAGSGPAQTSVKVPDKVITAEQRAFWSFQPLKKPMVPAVSHGSWPKSDIDRFVLARLEKDGLTPVRAADKRTLIRRATLDLTGLPPTYAEIEAFEKDSSPRRSRKSSIGCWRRRSTANAGAATGSTSRDTAKTIRAASIPKDAGYAPYPNAYLYRDWVVKAFNDDLPYDQFIKAQLAGDLLDERTRARTLPALGLLGLGPWYYDNGSVEITHADERHDRVDVVSRGFLGLTVACARCHDHKYDPILAKDYYALAGVFLNSPYHEYPLAPKAVADEYDAQAKKVEQKEKLLDKFLETESRQLAETLAFSASSYMQSAWKVTGEPKKEMARVVNEDKLDFELLERWVRFLAKPPKFYPYVTEWQAMIKRGGTAADAKTLADEFQAADPRRDVREEGHRGRERHHPRQGAARHEEEEGREPAERVHHERRLLSRLRPRAEEPAEPEDPVLDRRLPAGPRGRLRPLVCRLRAPGPAGVPRLGRGALPEWRPADARRHPARGHQGDEEGAAAEVRLRARRAGRREAAEPAARHPRQSDEARRRSAAALPHGAELWDADAADERQRTAGARGHHRQCIRSRRA